MPELPDVELYVGCLRPRVVGQALERVRVFSPFVVRTVEPPLSELHGREVRDVRRMGKRIVFRFADELYLIIHLMIAGRLLWKKPGAARAGKIGLAALDFAAGSLHLTEAGTKKRAALHVVRGDAALRRHDPGGLEVLECGFEEFAAALRRESHTLKRALTDPRLFSGIGNAYSDEILHAARLSPLALTARLSDEEAARLFEATKATLIRWTETLQLQFADRFPGPGDVTAFRDGFAVHGRYGRPCPDCGCAVQRIRYAENETNYCPVCQTQGRVLADRSLSRLLKGDWPRSVDELRS